MEMVLLLLKNGAPVNVANKEKKTPRDIAQTLGNEDIAEILAQTGKIFWKTTNNNNNNKKKKKKK